MVLGGASAPFSFLLVVAFLCALCFVLCALCFAFGVLRFALVGDLAGGRAGRGLVLRLPALNAGLDGRVPRAARSVLTAGFRRAAPDAVLTRMQCPRRLRRLLAVNFKQAVDRSWVVV